MTALRFKKRWIILALIVVSFLPQVPSCTMANTPKIGRVVDVTTGNGMPDVAVIAAAKIYAGSVYSSGSNIYRVITHTDADGNYRIPGTWLQALSNLPFRLPGYNAHIAWMVTAFKPGYALAQDEDAWSEYLDSGQPKYWPPSAKITPSSLWLGFVVKVDPLDMRPVQFTLRQAAIYYKQIFTIGDEIVWDRPDEVALREHAYRTFAPQVCALSPLTEMDSYEAYSFEGFVYDAGKFNEVMRKIEPLAFKGGSDLSVFHAGNVCEAMKASERAL